MPVGFLTEDRRRRHGRFFEDPTQAQLARFCHLDDADRARLGTRQVDHNRLGFAVQLCTVRFLGTFLADPQEVPGSVVAYVAGQLAIDDPACFADYRYPQVHQRHAREIREAHGYRQFNDQAYHFLLSRWLFTRAWLSGERPIVLFDAATEWLIERKVLLPGASALERLVARARGRADARLWRILARAPSAEQQTRLKRLLETDATGFSQLDQLRRAPRRVSSQELVRASRRLADIRALGAGELGLNRIPPRRIRMLARYAAAARAQAIARMSGERQIATLVAFAREYELLAQDDVLDLFDLLIAKLLGEARDKGQRERLQTLHDLDRIHEFGHALGLEGAHEFSDNCPQVGPRLTMCRPEVLGYPLQRGSDEMLSGRNSCHTVSARRRGIARGWGEVRWDGNRDGLGRRISSS
jgi:hypothetical protein